MPTRPSSPCTYPGCTSLVSSGRCPQHQAIKHHDHDQRRGSAHSRGYTGTWAKAAKSFLRSNPLCMCPDCDQGNKRVTIATVVDHRIPHRGDMQLFWNVSNWQSMGKLCHDRKTGAGQ